MDKISLKHLVILESKEGVKTKTKPTTTITSMKRLSLSTYELICASSEIIAGMEWNTQNRITSRSS